MTSKEIREKWLRYFESKGHLRVESKSLIPVNDPSLLWINSGVATLKDYFSGKKQPPKNRLTNSQKAIRTNDIENVGLTSRHHTFFEMLGNFSIGDYFKKEAIEFGYEFLTKELKLDPKKLYMTYYSEDLETKQYWIDQGVKESHLIPGTRDTNFWDVGSGPCGPDTEIFYDRGPKYNKRGLELLKKDIENDRYIEIWNIVFSQFNNDGEGNYTELKQKNIDTGAGLERIASIMQDAPTNYDSDLFINIIKEIEKFSTFKYDVENYFKKNKAQTEININFKVIADHIRTVTNAIADGAKVSNVGRGYIIRRLIRRSIYKGMQLGIKGLFLYKLVDVVQESLPFEYDKEVVKAAIKEEEITFSQTIEKGKILLEKFMDKKTKIFSGDDAFNLLETYGFPIELTVEILAKKNIKVDMKAFEEAKEKHANLSRGQKVSGMDQVINSLALIKDKVSEFVGYSTLESKSRVLKLFNSEEEVDSINGEAYLLLDKTPFYATSGGQNHDHGYILQNKNKIKILDVFKDKFGNHIHKVEGKINNKEALECFVDSEIRAGMARGHSATHLLFCALREVLGPQIEQLGSDIIAERLTFDFPADSKPSDLQIKQIEDKMHNWIKRDIKREYIVTNIQKAKELGAIMTISEYEYMDAKNIRIVKFDGVTSDLCGGTHVDKTSFIEDFKITNVERKQAGIFRIRAVTSHKYVQKHYQDVNKKLKEDFEALVNKAKSIDAKYVSKFEPNNDIQIENESIKKQIETVREDIRQLIKVKSEINYDIENVVLSKGSNYSYYINLNVESSQVKISAAKLREQHQDAVIILGSKNGDQILLAVASKVLDSNKLFQQIASKANGRGGGNPIISIGKISNIDNIESIIKELL
ncbi:alanine--tRNA ligase [Mycoplasmopsis caviae]|uniref:Alanine--tRNA ligase n=1 Tax=Mycoplasmopsis caviae TaxID=55603 RepID=A0A3P8L7W9_9BACT|nr:alanine--tRNA ligase [Mycoplasmopsis caviae]UUD35755.1 alanine--tRNA ligase [Mycoplasmopsis caviae]VDR42405.1 Alanine--tRNA ligase [Mycoplasmopsis caviae]